VSQKKPIKACVASVVPCLFVCFINCGTHNSLGSDPLSTAHTLFVAHDAVLVSYDIATGRERPGTVTDLATPTDMQALEDGKVIVNLTGKNQFLVVDGHDMLATRLPSSNSGGTRPVHSYISPSRNGKRYWLALNDGQNSDPATSKATFVNLTATSANYLKEAGEVGLGVGHHKATFSNTVERVVISNISDCNDVLSVYDYSNPANIQKLITWNARSLGWDDSTRERHCDPTYQTGAPPAPHGCGTSKQFGKAYCNLTSTGEIVVIDIDKNAPTAKVLHTSGSGAGYTKPNKDGRSLYSLQATPREVPGARTCQIGQLVVIDASTDLIAKEVPLLYKGPGCTSVLSNTDEASAEPDHIRPSLDGKKLYISTAGAFGNASARVRQELVVDVSNPGNPIQRASIPVGTSTEHHGDALSGDGRLLFVTNNIDGTVTQIDTSTDSVMKTLTVQPSPKTVATFGSNEGPSEQTGPLE
jgi:YVTN family beta-propeller protein